MTAAYFDKSAYKAKLKALFAKKEVAEAKKLFSALFDEFENSPVFAMASRFVRFNSENYINLKKLLTISMTESGVPLSVEEILLGQPLMVLGKNLDMVRVYPNLILDKTDNSSVGKVCFCLNPDTLGTFYKAYKDAMANDNTKIGWASIKAAWHKIKRHEDIATARALTRFTKLADKGVTDAKIRDIAAGVDEQRKPMELIYCMKPEDMIKMYETGPTSCMTNNKARDHGWKESLFDHGLHPTSFFFFHPYIKGVYATYKKAVCARTFIYQLADGRWQYGRVYASNEKMKERFEQSLIAKGCTFMGHHETHKYDRPASFRVPAGRMGDSPILPTPYCDNLENKIHATYDEAAKDFIVECGTQKSNVHHQMQNGYTVATALKGGMLCGHCGEPAGQHGRPIEASDGRWFCHPDHARAAGYVHATRSDATVRWVRNNAEIVYDRLSGVYFTNEEAARARGALPGIHAFFDDEEAEDWLTCAGIPVYRKGELYNYIGTGSAWGEWQAAGQVRQTLNHHHHGQTIYEFVKGAECELKISIKKQRVVEIADNEPAVIAA